uniref:Uncharacterized protein n=1 Tax=Dictyoglomus turgidum TaxID=513050 RepID=A0A7C3WN25_9BACT
MNKITQFLNKVDEYLDRFWTKFWLFFNPKIKDKDYSLLRLWWEMTWRALIIVFIINFILGLLNKVC